MSGGTLLQVQEPMSPRNFASRLKAYIDKRKKQTAAGPVIPCMRMPDDLSKIERKSR